MDQVQTPKPEGSSARPEEPRDAGFWSKHVATLAVTDAPAGAVNKNVTGRRVTSPVQGFGRMWQKTYRVDLGQSLAKPTDVIREWKANFSTFWPEGNHFYGALTGIAPGDVALLNLAMPGKLTLSTGMLVLYADDESFTLMTPEGHQFAAWITFSAFEDDGGTIAQVQTLLRASDPVFEIALACGGHKMEDRFWDQTLTNLAAAFGVHGAPVRQEMVCLDRKRQWKNARYVWYNSAIRSGIYMMTTPFRIVSRPFRARRTRRPA